MKSLSLLAITASLLTFSVGDSVAPATAQTTSGPDVVAPPQISSPAAGSQHSCIVRDADVWCTGANSRGQLGNGTFVRTTAFASSLMKNAISVAAGSTTTCAIGRDNSLWCWGTIPTSLNELGDIVRTDTSSPTQLGLADVRSVSVGPLHSCAVLYNEQAWCWGRNSFGQLGNGSRTHSVTPVQVAGEHFVTIDVGTDHTCATKRDHSVWCWGSNTYKRLGQLSARSLFVPTKVPRVAATSVAAGDGFTCIIATIGKVQCWGRNQYGQLGRTAGSSRYTPHTLSIKKPVTLSAGSEFACATTEAQTAWCWGRNRYGQLANGSFIAKSRPQKIVANSQMGIISRIATGESHACGTNQAHSAMWCWGLGTSGQIGDSANSNRTRGTIVWQNGIRLASIGSDTSARILVTGDLACDEARRMRYGLGPLGTQCGEQATSDLALRLNPQALIALGDLQYEGASIGELENFYDPTWGRLKSITYPIRGNHEYITNGAAGYVEYFGAISPSYWVTDAGGWRIIAVDSWCQGLLYAGCSATSPQTQWLAAQLQQAKTDRRCTAVLMHHPLVSSGPFPTSHVRHLWAASVDGGADLVLTGHDHHYERFAPLDNTGAPAATGGTPLIIAGIGGAQTYPLRTTAAGSQSVDNKSHGVVELSLTPTTFSTKVISAVDGSESDIFTSPCNPS